MDVSYTESENICLCGESHLHLLKSYWKILFWYNFVLRQLLCICTVIFLNFDITSILAAYGLPE